MPEYFVVRLEGKKAKDAWRKRALKFMAEKEASKHG
jgi:hypothetical protein